MKKKENEKKVKVKKREKLAKRSVLDKVVIVFLAFALLIGICGASLVGYIISSTKVGDLFSQMINKEPSTYYDVDTQEFASLGVELRENISYKDIPESTIDAFLAIEDSRFFKHNGFDLPRFISSALTNLKSGSFAQGGSTLTMQAIDNFWMKPEENAMDEAGKSFSSIEKIERKLKEIYMSMCLETQASKEEIFEKYVNEINFGDNARGIERGAQHFFGKSVKELNLSESAYLAGCINAPNTYNPYNGYDSTKKANYYQYATERRDDTLQMMLQHGFITKTEYNLAKSTKLAFQVVGKNTSTTEPYKDFIDAANKEVMALTKKDPATTPMKIYTTMDKKAQDLANKGAAGEIIGLSDNKDYQIASTMINNSTGGIMAVCAGRTDIEQTVYKARFSDVDRLPGSSIKPIIDYAYALDRLGYCTGRVYNDKEMTIDGKKKQNADGKFYGKVSMERAIAQSLNMPAIQTLQDAVDRGLTEDVKTYLVDMGFSQSSLEDFNVLYSIGSTISVSPTQMAGAFATLANYGEYITPHMITRIEFKDGKTPAIDIKQARKKVLSPQAAYMTSDLLYKAINGEYKGWNLMGMLGFGAYPVYGKTGTSDWADNGLQWGIPLMAMKDEWMVNYTSEYTIATWSGFDKGGPGNYVDNALLYKNIPGYINKTMLDTLSKNPILIANPGGISSYGGGMIKTEFLQDAAKNNPMTITNSKSVYDDLETLYNSIKDTASDNYTVDSYTAFKSSLEEAKKMMDENKATEEEFTAMLTKLQQAYDALASNINKAPLISAINSAADINANSYTSASYKNLKNVVDNAKAVLGRDNLTQQEIDAQITLINNAIAGLVGKGNYSDLQTAINKAQAKLNAMDASNPNRGNLQTAINNATAILNNTSASQNDINAQTNSLNAILSTL